VLLGTSPHILSVSFTIEMGNVIPTFSVLLMIVVRVILVLSDLQMTSANRISPGCKKDESRLQERRVPVRSTQFLPPNAPNLQGKVGSDSSPDGRGGKFFREYLGMEVEDSSFLFPTRRS